MKINSIAIDKIIPYHNNPRKDQAVDKVASSINEYGFQQPIVVDKNMVVVVGHTRLMGAKKLGLKKVPTVIADLSDTQAKAYRIADNRINEDSTWDMELLNLEIAGLSEVDFDLDLLGFDSSELDKFFVNDEEYLTDEDEVPEPPKEPKSKLGDVYQLGDHRLMCGNSCLSEDVDKLMDGKISDMVFTDPPYNVSIGTIKHSKFKQREILNDSMTKNDFRSFCVDFASSIKEFNRGIIYCWSGQGEDGRVMFTVLDEFFHNSTTIIWKKQQFTLGRGKYQNQYEPCWFGWNKDGSSFSNDRKLVNVWEVNRPQKSELHPTMKPVELTEIALTHSSKMKDIVLDLFGGSGSTLIACEKLQRQARMMELDPKYVDVIIQRWENFTGKKAKKIC